MTNKLLALAGSLVVANALAADPIHGTWKTVPDDNGNFGHVVITDCDGRICGTLETSFDSSGASLPSENIGKQIIWDMKAEGSGKYAGGKIWSPDRDKVYKSKLELLDNDSLAVSGCILFICRDGGTWERVD